jgi:hypothetical protein
MAMTASRYDKLSLVRKSHWYNAYCVCKTPLASLSRVQNPAALVDDANCGP